MPRGRPPKIKQPDSNQVQLEKSRLIISVVRVKNTWPKLCENFMRSAGYLAKALGFETFILQEFEGIHCRAVAKSKTYSSSDRGFACRDSFAQLVKITAQSDFGENDWFLFCEDDLDVSPNCPILTNVPEQVKMVNLSWANRPYKNGQRDVSGGGKISYESHPQYPGFAKPVCKDMVLGTAFLVMGRAMLSRFAEHDFKSKSNWDINIGFFMESNLLESVLPIPAIAGQLVEPHSNHYQFKNYSGMTIPWGLGLKNPVFEIPKLSGTDTATQTGDTIYLEAEENIGFWDSDEYLNFKSRYEFFVEVEDCVVFSNQKLDLIQIDELCKPIWHEKSSVVTATNPKSPHKSMQPGSNFRIVPMFQPHCFAIRKETLEFAGLPDENAFPYWGSDVEWSIRIRNTWSSKLNEMAIIGAVSTVTVDTKMVPVSERLAPSNPHKDMVNRLNEVCANWRTYASAGGVTENWKNW